MLWNKKLPKKVTEEILLANWDNFRTDISLHHDSAITPKEFKRRHKRMVKYLKRFLKDNRVKFDEAAYRRHHGIGVSILI